MWFKRSNTRIENLETGLSFVVREVADTRGVKTWEVVASSAVRGWNTVLCEGYKTEAEAVAALDEFLSAQEILPVAIQPPVTDEEIKEDEEENE